MSHFAARGLKRCEVLTTKDEHTYAYCIYKDKDHPYTLRIFFGLKFYPFHYQEAPE